MALHPLGQLHHLVVDVGFLGGFDDFFLCGVGLAVSDVLFDGAFEDVVLLKDESDVVAEELGVVVMQVHAIEQDLSAVGLVEFVEEVDDGGFTCS